MNRETVQRLSQYKNVLHKLKSLGFVRVFSDNLADALGVSASLVRKDFSTFGFTGNKRGGYRIDELLEKMDRLFGKNEIKRIVVVGCGKIGMALINHHGFAREGIRVLAGFDTDPEVINPEASFPIYDVSELPEFVKREKISVAAMAVPEGAAGRVLDTLVECGIHGVLNFTPLQLKSREDCVIHNINIAMEIEKLFYLLRFNENAGQDKVKAPAS
ncbi:redox-sensing transcriptional repressor Rex [Kiritimatiella glycovorans]|uniref:Redox-sensing transcriptional repressor Rex n=1 Tax=Kiritimatiella glycovorans TaxID=1307763 RepID=A0A0G3EBI0_9BACT|nr:redox-sensing transcriptional repressor Rex [Kiritimatiella glycovorans]AKJ63663.1 Redox-sensing transcriptional repressor rex [Kiritimatiella glycovorans]